MATKLTKPITRELVKADRGRVTVVTIEPPDQITFRTKGSRTRYSVSLRNVELLAIMRGIYDNYVHKLETYRHKKAAGCKKLKKPKPPNYNMFSPIYRAALKQ